jgi:ubiquinone/menaquinone biosynthesis C-methylase UbiE
MEFKDHFSGVAEQYAKFRPVYPAGLYAWLLPLCENKDTAWDVGTGSGQVAVELSAHFKRVYASDASPEQIGHAARRENIEYGVYPAEASPLAAGSIDLVTAGQALHWFDFERFWQELRRVCKPGAIFACWTYRRNHFEDRGIMNVVDEFYEMMEPYWPPERDLVENCYNDIPFPFPLLKEELFQMPYTFKANSLIAYYSTWSAVVAYKKKHGINPLSLFETRLREAWGNAEDERVSFFPLTIKVFKVHQESDHFK